MLRNIERNNNSNLLVKVDHVEKIGQVLNSICKK